MLANVLMIAAAVATSSPGRLPPVDRCGGDADFAQFRSAIKDAVTRKDPAALRKLAASNIQSNFGGEGSWKEFATTWGLDQPEKSELWEKMQEVMALGCAKTEDDGRVFPGLFDDVGEDVDVFELLVARPGAVLRASADKHAPAIARLDWTSTLQIESPAPENWVKVQVPSGETGWVETDLLISPLDYRLVSEKRDGRWQITAFIAGD